LIAFFFAVLLLIITPGPGVLSTAGIGSGFGFRAGLAYVLGLWVGNNAVAIAVVTGLAAILFSVPWLRTALLVLSTAYLFYLAAKIAFSGSKIAFIRSDSPPGFLGGLMLQAVNPKAYVVHTTLMSGFAFMPQNLTAEIAIKFIIMNLVWIPLHLAWLWAGVTINRLDLTPKTQRMINMGMALAMLAVVGLAAFYRS
jgi:threonine/homoserine/homoserine lactone efflux protein